MKKYIKYIVVAAIFFFVLAHPVYAADANLALCEDSGVLKTFQLGGYALYVVKIVVPILLVIFGMIDMFKAVISSDENSIKKETGTLIKRGIMAIVVFLVPVIVNAVFLVIDSYSTVMDEYKDCYNCLMEPSNEEVCKA